MVRQRYLANSRRLEDDTIKDLEARMQDDPLTVTELVIKIFKYIYIYHFF